MNLQRKMDEKFDELAYFRGARKTMDARTYANLLFSRRKHTSENGKPMPSKK